MCRHYLLRYSTTCDFPPCDIGVVRPKIFLLNCKDFLPNGLALTECMLLLLRFYSTSSWTYQAFYSSPHIPYWFCFGLKFTTRYNHALWLLVFCGQNCLVSFAAQPVKMNLVTCIWNSGSDQYTSRYSCCSITYQHCYKHLGTQSTCFDLTSGWCLGEQARSLPTDNLRPAFLITNAVIYVIQVIYLWKLYWLKILCTTPSHGSLECSVKSTLYLGWQLAGLHLGVFVVVTNLSGPHCGKNFLCWYAVSSLFLKQD